MSLPALHTNLAELNRLYGRYYAYLNEASTDLGKADQLWSEYIAYYRQYNLERGLPVGRVKSSV